MYLDGRKILTSSTMLTRRQKTLIDSFDIDLRHVLEAGDPSDADLTMALTARHTLEPLVILPTSFSGQPFHEVHRGVPGLTETFCAFGRDVPFTGDISLWNFTPGSSSLTDLRMKFSTRGEAMIKGVCTVAECSTIDEYLERKIDYVRSYVLPMTTQLLKSYNVFVEDRADWYVRTRAGLIARIRKEVAAA